MSKVFDIGMFDGADTAYYLEQGHQVVAVEANPQLVEQAQSRFAREIARGQLHCVHAAISPDGEAVQLHLSGHDLGSSSLYSERIQRKRPIGAITVPGITVARLVERHGLPDYLKVDIEGADRHCVLALSRGLRPPFLSFEVGDDADELIAHAEAIGYRGFKLINQNSFRELANVRSLYDRVSLRLMRYLGYREPRFVRRGGRFFVAGHSSGPEPWRSDGRWHSGESTRRRLREARAAAGGLGDWYDVHAVAEGR